MISNVNKILNNSPIHVYGNQSQHITNTCATSIVKYVKHLYLQDLAYGYICD